MEIIGTIGAAVGSAGTAIGTGLSSLASSATLGTVVQGASTAASMLASIAGGRDARRQAGLQAQAEQIAAGIEHGNAQIAARDEYLAGQAAALDLRKGLADFASDNLVAFSASGLDTASASAILEQARADTEWNVKLAERPEAAAMPQSNVRAYQTTIRGANAARSSGLEALQAALSFGFSALGRGGPGLAQAVTTTPWKSSLPGKT